MRAARQFLTDRPPSVDSPPSGQEKSQRQVALLRLGAVVIVAVVVIFVAWAIMHKSSKSSAKKSNSKVYNLKQLKEFASTINHPIWWVGPITDPRDRYEVRNLKECHEESVPPQGIDSRPLSQARQEARCAL